jgi:ABC-type sugar transport system substrate-binding protein
VTDKSFSDACNEALSSLINRTQLGAVFAQEVLPSTKAKPSKSRSIPSKPFLFTSSVIDLTIAVRVSVLAKYPGLKLLASQTGEWDRAKSMALMENWIQSYGDQIQAVFAQNDEMGLGAVQALMDAKKKQSVYVVSVDGIKDAKKSVSQGNLDATIIQNAGQQGSEALRLALELVQKKPLKESNKLIPFEIFVK